MQEIGNISDSIGIYVRESRDENEENYETIETQKGLLLKYATDNKLGNVYRIYIDDNVSGTTFDRPGIRELEQDIISGYIDLLLVKDLSRLGRNNAKTLLFLDFLEEHGVRIISSDGRFDSNADSDLAGIESWINERYAKDISRKIRSNLKHKIQNGEFLGKAPYGYDKSISKKNTLQINTEHAQIVIQIYKMYLDGLGYSKIANYLNERKIPPPSRAKGLISCTQKWNSVAIQRILTNRVYLGQTIQGVSEKISFKSKKTRRLSSDKWIVTPQTHEKIIDEQLFEAVNALRKSKNVFSCTDKGYIHTYRGMIFCGRCGNVMYARKRKGRELGYVCQSYTKYGKAACSSHYVKESTVNAAIAEELELLINNAYAKNAIEQNIKNINESVNEEDKRNFLQKSLNSLKVKQEKMYIDMLDGLITRELFIRMNNSIEESIARLDLQLKNEMTKTKADLDVNSLIKEIEQLCLENSFPYQLSKMLIKKITIFEAGECLQTLLQGENIYMNDTDGVILVEFNS